MDANRAPAPAQPYGEVFDRGYQHYTGAREGRSHAIQALVLYSLKRGLGIKKKWTAKIIPIALYLIAFSPALILVGVLSFVPAGTTLSYPFLNGFLLFTLLVFAAAGAPEMLCDDRRENVLPLYFSRTITRLDYLLAKIVALFILMGTIAFGPSLLLFLGKTFLADSPLSYLGHHVDDLGRIAVFGALVSIYYAAIGLSIAAFTTRKGVAAAIFIGLVLILGALTNSLYEALEQGWRKYLLLLDPAELITAISRWLFNEQPGNGNDLGSVTLSGYLLVAGVVGVVIVAGYIMYRRYLSDE